MVEERTIDTIIDFIAQGNVREYGKFLENSRGIERLVKNEHDPTKIQTLFTAVDTLKDILWGAYAEVGIAHLVYTLVAAGRIEEVPREYISEAIRHWEREAVRMMRMAAGHRAKKSPHLPGDYNEWRENDARIADDSSRGYQEKADWIRREYEFHYLCTDPVIAPEARE